MKHTLKLMLALALAISTALSLASCSLFAEKIVAADLMEGYEAEEFEAEPVGKSPEAVGFALRMLSAISKSADADDKGGESIVISPYSIISAFALAANGAKGETLSQMEEALGFTLDELNRYLPSYTASLKSGDKAKVTAANSIWMRDTDSLHVVPEFLQTNANLYGADAYSAPFDDSTVRDINNWIEEKTDGMIKDMLDAIPPDAVMYLVNVVLFDAEWAEIYEKSQVEKGDFTNAEGKTEKVDFLNDPEGRGFRLDGAVGLSRRYSGGDYEFVGILPDEGTTPGEYLKNLDADDLIDALSDLKSARTKIPKFTIETKTELSEILSAMGMTDAFDGGKADFTGMAASDDGNIYIGRVLHNAKIELDARGTKAGAATVIEMKTESAPVIDEDIIDVFLDRPFIFFICDTATHTPIFAGILNSVG